jgi:hypothetical protein
MACNNICDIVGNTVNYIETSRDNVNVNVIVIKCALVGLIININP